MKKYVDRAVSLVLVLILCVSMLAAPASAAGKFVYKPSPTDGNVFMAWLRKSIADFAGISPDSISFDTLLLPTTGEVKRTQMQDMATNYNNWFNRVLSNPVLGLVIATKDKLFNEHQAVIAPDPMNGIMRLKDNTTGKWIYDSQGRFPFYYAMGDTPTEGPGTAPAEVPATPSISGNKFIDARAVKWSPRAISTKDAFGELIINLGKEGVTATLAKNSIPKGDGSGYTEVWYVANAQKTAVYCNSLGMPYTASAEPSIVDNDFNYIVDNSDNSTNTTIDNKVIDTSNNQMVIINENGDKVTLNIDSLYWDDSTHSYTANTYNIVNNTYNYYTYNITYNITNTYINYIGSNAAFEQDEYKYYYELPDGRSSEDLTAEEVAGMSFQFADVTNYARSATDTSLRALYHFDGNTDDSGYFSTQTKFAWETGASITYMDSAGFNGALYLDELAHNFDIDLPSNFSSSSDFSVQWRHYQASQPDTQANINNSLYIGGNLIMKWDERSFYWNGSSTATASVPVGSWHELALIRNNGILYFYINGVKVASKADTTGYQGKLMFNFGAGVRAYSMIDELRVVNFAVAKAGVSYRCATVPYDTNLVLVLPDGAFPVADEYWEFNNSTTVSSFDFTAGCCPAGCVVGSEDAKKCFFNDGYTSYSTSAPFAAYNDFALYASQNRWGLNLNFIAPNTALSTAPYYFSVVDATGKVYTSSPIYLKWDFGYLTFRQSNGRYSGSLTLTLPCGVLYFFGGDPSSNTLPTVSFLPTYGSSVDIRYCEFATTPITAAQIKKVSCIYSSEDIAPNTAAVQSSIPVNGYTVGGVRPTFPVRGDVWFPVEGRRITGCYIYDGSMWRTAGCRYYTGTRWIPIYAFDIYTLADCWDVADGGDVDSTPPITTEQGFWNWFKKEWNDFRKWGNTSLELIIKAIVASGGAPSEECTKHEYRYKDIKSATCTAKGSRLFTCTKCGDTYTEETDHLGHDWLQIDDIQDTTSESGETVKGYALWECSRCKLQHKDYDRTGPPPAEGESTITELITNLFDKLGGLVGSVVDWLLELGTEAVDGLGDIGDYFKEKAGEVGGFGGEFLLLLSGFFDIIPPELTTCMSLAIVFLVLGLFVKKVLLK